MKYALLWMSATIGLVLGLSHASSQPVPVQPDRCFAINQLEGWRAPDARTIIIRANLNKYYTNRRNF